MPTTIGVGHDRERTFEPASGRLGRHDGTGRQYGRLDRLVPRIVLDWVTDEPERRWRVVEGTMVFADISGFTALSEKLATRGRIGTEELVETLSRLFAGMLDITVNRSTGGHGLQFHGRESELAAVRNRIEAGADGHGGVVTLIGAAGLGKSRLVREALGSDHPRIVDMHAEPYGTSDSYRVVREPMRSLFGLSGTDSAALGEQLRVTVTKTAPQLEPFLPLLGNALQLALPSTMESDSISAQFRADRTADVVLELIVAIHDEPLGRIASATQLRPWLLISLRRDDDGGFVTALGEHLPIEPPSWIVMRPSWRTFTRVRNIVNVGQLAAAASFTASAASATASAASSAASSTASAVLAAAGWTLSLACWA